MKRVAIYVRVSTAEQAEHGYSLETQLEACKNKAKEFGAESVREFIDNGYSGEFIDRPAIASLRAAMARKEFEFVIVYDPDRLARNLAHQLIITDDIEKSGAQLVFVSVTFEQSPEGRLFYSMRGAISAYEKEKIKERTMRGKRGKAARGKLVNNGRPYGYSYDADKSTYIVKQDEAKIVKMIYNLIVEEKKGTSLICKELNALGIPSPRSKPTWIISSIHRILTNTLYKGIVYSMKYRYEKTGLKKKKRTIRPESEWIPISVPPIVDEITWEAAQRQLKLNKDNSTRNLKRDHLLNTLVYCARCGHKMSITHSGTVAKSYYVCLSQKSAAYSYSGQKPCGARRIPTEVLDKYVVAYLSEISERPSLIDYHVSAQSSQNIDAINTKINQIVATEHSLTKQRDTVIRWFRQLMISEQEADTQLNEIKIQLQNIAQTKSRYNEELAAISPNLTAEQIYESLEMNFYQQNFNIEEKRVAIKSIIDKVIAERIDNTYAKGSKPELRVHIKFL